MARPHTVLNVSRTDSKPERERQYAQSLDRVQGGPD